MRRALLVAALLLLVLPSSAKAALGGENGGLVTVEGGCLRLLAPDGSGYSQPGACGFGGAASPSLNISPDGNRIAGTLVFEENIDGDIFYSEQVRVSALDGSNQVLLSPRGDFASPSWAPDGGMIAVTTYFDYSACCGYDSAVAIFAPDGSPPPPGSPPSGPSFKWANDNKLAWTNRGFTHTQLFVKAYAASSGSVIYTAPAGKEIGGFDWAPTSDRLAVAIRGTQSATQSTDIITMNPDGSGQQTVASLPASDLFFDFSWSPDGTGILFTRRAWATANPDVFVLNPDRTGLTNLTADNAGYDFRAYWSPDSKKIAFRSDRGGSATDIYVMNRDGSGLVPVTNGPASEELYGWQPILRGYPRPKGAAPVHASLVPAYEPCTTPNRTHAPPLSFSSCNPPSASSTQLTIGTPDANRARPPRSHRSTSASRRATPAPRRRCRAGSHASITDVRNASDLSDHTGSLEAPDPPADHRPLQHALPRRSRSGHHAVFTYTFAIPCTATADTTIGSTCTLTTTADSLPPTP